ncbi:MAG: DUF2278 family protein [Candidatus Electronema sp. VV]
MPITKYGVWVANPKSVDDTDARKDRESPHIHLFYDDGTGGTFTENTKRASINVKSVAKPSELVFWIVQDFRHPITDKLRDLRMGFHQLPSKAGGAALDYLRGNLMELSKGRMLPHNEAGPQNDIIDFVMPELQAAVNRKAVIYLFGAPYSDSQGIHNIHMNQGNIEKFRNDDGIYQDGAIIMHFPDEDRFSAIFLAFASQSVQTDDQGHRVPGSKTLKDIFTTPENPSETASLSVAIIAALVNPVGPENQPNSTGRPETIYLLNRTNGDISLKGWSLVNNSGQSYAISDDAPLAAGELRTVAPKGVPLSNQGGTISLLDAKGAKADGVSYTKEQAKEEGQLVIFR